MNFAYWERHTVRYLWSKKVFFWDQQVTSATIFAVSFVFTSMVKVHIMFNSYHKLHNMTCSHKDVLHT